MPARATRQHDDDSGPPRPVARLAYTLSDAARELSIGRTTLYRMLANEEVDTFEIRGMRRVPWEEIDRLRKARRRPRSPANDPGPLPGPGFPEI
jgi:hypothetical protein